MSWLRNSKNWILDVLSEWFVRLERICARWSGGSSTKSRREHRKERREFDEWIEKCKKDPNIKSIVIAGRRY